MQQNVGTTPVKRERRWRAVLLFAASTTVLWVLLFRGCWAVCDVKPAPVWTAAPGQTVPPTDFRFIGFPVSGGAPLYDADHNVLGGTLSRAVKMSANEQGANWIGLILAEGGRRLSARM